MSTFAGMRLHLARATSPLNPYVPHSGGVWSPEGFQCFHPQKRFNAQNVSGTRKSREANVGQNMAVSVNKFTLSTAFHELQFNHTNMTN